MTPLRAGGWTRDPSQSELPQDFDIRFTTLLKGRGRKHVFLSPRKRGAFLEQETKRSHSSHRPPTLCALQHPPDRRWQRSEVAACHHHRCQEKNWTLPRRRETPLRITATSSSAWLEEGGKATSLLCSWGPQKGSLALCSRGYSAELFSEPGSCYPDLLLHGTGTELSTLELSLHPLPRCHQKPHTKTTPTNLHHCTLFLQPKPSQKQVLEREAEKLHRPQKKSLFVKTAAI